MVKIILAASLAAIAALAAPARAATYNLVIEEIDINITGSPAKAVAINGQVPGPVLRWQEGEDVTVNVTNRLKTDTSIHWHGVLVPMAMDGVPHLTFAGIKPGETYTYRLTLKQAGTYWYHSHSGGQEQAGMYAPIVITPKGGERIKAARDYVVMLSDWTDMRPDAILAKLKKQSNYFNDHRRTWADLNRALAAAKSQAERDAIWADRKDWARMRMDPTDLADVSGYTFLVNGQTPSANWTGLFKPGERVRLRVINGSAMTLFDLRLPGLKMTVVQADGQDVKPVTVDEFRIAVGETYDVIVEPKEDRAYTIYAQSIDRRGFARATLAPRPGMQAEIPPLRAPSTLMMADMGDMGGMDHANMDHAKPAPPVDGGAKVDHSQMDHSKMDHAKMGKPMADETGKAAAPPGLDHAPPIGAEPGARVLSYADLERLDRRYKLAPPARTIEMRLTGNMDRYFWSFNDKKYSEAEPIRLKRNEVVRLVLKNETMMNHPIHLHGLWMDLDNGAGDGRPRKHVVNVPPGRTVTVDVTASEVGTWAFHCHLMFHMMTGMFREIIVEPGDDPPPLPPKPGPQATPQTTPQTTPKPAPRAAPMPMPAGGGKGGGNVHHH